MDESWFSKTDDGLRIMDFIYFQSQEVPPRKIREMLCISKPTATKWKKQYQHACHEEVATIDEKIGGPENVVEADATYLCTKRKY